MGFVVGAPFTRRFFTLGTTTSSLAICLVIGAATSAMAQAGAGAAYAMTYLDVSTDWVLQGAGLIKAVSRYEPARGGQPGIHGAAGDDEA